MVHSSNHLKLEKCIGTSQQIYAVKTYLRKNNPDVVVYTKDIFPRSTIFFN